MADLIVQHPRSSTAGGAPTGARLADGQLGVNTRGGLAWVGYGAAPRPLVSDHAASREGSPHTVTSADYGLVITVDADLTLPVVPAGDVLRRVDVWAFGAVELIEAANVTIVADADPKLLADNDVVSLLVATSDGTNTTWRVS